MTAPAASPRVLVPREPTEAMQAVADRMNPPMGPPERLTDEYCTKWRERTRKSYAGIYAAMIAAAPPADSPEGVEAVAWMQGQASSAYVRYADMLRHERCLGAEAKIRAGQFAPENLAAHTKAGELLGAHRAYADCAKFLSASPPPAAVEREAVAWACEGSTGVHFVSEDRNECVEEAHRDGSRVIPLYAESDTAELDRLRVDLDKARTDNMREIARVAAEMVDQKNVELIAAHKETFKHLHAKLAEAEAELAKVREFFIEVAELTIHHDELNGVAVVHPGNLGDALARVDHNWIAALTPPCPGSAGRE